MKELTIILAPDATEAYAAGDELDVLLDGRKVGDALDLRPGGEAFPGKSLPPVLVGNGTHVVSTVVRNALGTATAAYEAEVEVESGPRPAADLVFVSQVDDGPIVLGFTPSPDAEFIGGYILYRGLTLETVDWETPIATALTGETTITDASTRPITDGTLVYALRAAYTGGLADDADPPVAVAVNLVAGVVQPPVPLAVNIWQVEPAADGRIRVTAAVNNVDAAVPAASLRIYVGEGVPSYAEPAGEIAGIGLGGGTYPVLIDPGLAHGATAAVVVRAASAEGVEETNTNVKTCVVASNPPPQFTGVTFELA